MPPGRSQDAPRTPPRRPKTAQDAPRRPKMAPRRLQDASRTPQGAPETPAFSTFWNHGALDSLSLTCHTFYWLYRAIVFVMTQCSGSVDFITPLSVVPLPKMRAAALAEGLYNTIAVDP